MTGELRLREILPEPGRLWIRSCPVSWPGAPGDWVDLRGPSLGVAAAGAIGALPAERLAKLDDVVYLPPVKPEDEAERRTLAAQLKAAGVPVVLQAIPRTPGAEAPALLDLSTPLLAGRVDELAEVPRGSRVIWPWIAGLTDRPEVWMAGLDRLASAGVEGVVAVTPELTPRERRHLAERTDPESFADLFHRAPLGLTDFWQAAHGRGLEPFPERPLPAAPRSLAVRRRVAGDLALAGDLLLRAGEEVAAQSLLRAARRLDAEPVDLEALVREGNLGLLSWLDEASARAVREVLGSGRSVLLARLLDEVREGASAPGGEE